MISVSCLKMIPANSEVLCFLRLCDNITGKMGEIRLDLNAEQK